MPHIHTEPNQHDVTVSAWIFRDHGNHVEVFVHMHRKMQKYMEVGGHMELDETPWQAIAHELVEETGYSLDELELYQPSYMPTDLTNVIVHPVPTLVLTYQPVPGHYHTDMSYVFYAKSEPLDVPNSGESQDLRWMTFQELSDGVLQGTVLSDVGELYPVLKKAIESDGYKRVATKQFSLSKPPLNEEVIEKLAKHG